MNKKDGDQEQCVILHFPETEQKIQCAYIQVRDGVNTNNLNNAEKIAVLELVKHQLIQEMMEIAE